jgi:hypothetical protein
MDNSTRQGLLRQIRFWLALFVVLPLALICGPIRGIPLFWRVIDCSFGVFGILPLWLIRQKIKRLEALGGV